MKITDKRAVYKRAADKSAASRKRCWMMVIAVLLATAALSMNAFAGQWRIIPAGGIKMRAGRI